MSGRDRPDNLAEFAAPPFNAAADLCGDLLGARMRALFAGNQYMALPSLMAGFTGSHPGAGPVFYETLPPGIVVAQLRQGGLRVGCLELRFTPDVIAASPAALGRLHEDGLVEEPRWYASNTLALLVRQGNPARVSGLRDLARPRLRVALPNPETEGIGRLALRALAAAGGEELREKVSGTKQRAGETVLTTIHHRQSPAWLAEGTTDAAIVWETEARHHAGAGTPVEPVPIEPATNQRGHYAAAIVTGAPHREAAVYFLDYLTGPDGRASYARCGFTTQQSLAPRSSGMTARKRAGYPATAQRSRPRARRKRTDRSHPMSYAHSRTLDLPYEQAVPRVKEAFQAQGFGTLTEIDVTATLRDKLGEEMEPYIILGACNPQLAHRALDIEREIGLLLPCNVVVRAAGDGRTLVQALDPQVMVTVPGREELRPVAEEATRRIRAALGTLTT